MEGFYEPVEVNEASGYLIRGRWVFVARDGILSSMWDSERGLTLYPEQDDFVYSIQADSPVSETELRRIAESLQPYGE